MLAVAILTGALLIVGVGWLLTRKPEDEKVSQHWLNENVRNRRERSSSGK